MIEWIEVNQISDGHVGIGQYLKTVVGYQIIMALAHNDI